MRSLLDDLSRREFARLGVPLVATVAEGWPSLLMAREIDGPDSIGTTPTPKDDAHSTKGEGNGGRHTSEKQTDLHSLLIEIRYRYNAKESDASDQREQALGMPPREKSTEQSNRDAALGKSDQTFELKVGMFEGQKSLEKNLKAAENVETAIDLMKIGADARDAWKTNGGETEVAKLQKDTVEFVLNLMIEGALESPTEQMHPMLGFGAKKGATAFFAPEVDMINEGVTAVRHAVVRGDLTELREIANHAERVGFRLAFHLYFQQSFLHPRSSER
jgi:hypothetical protein